MEKLNKEQIKLQDKFIKDFQKKGNALTSERYTVERIVDNLRLISDLNYNLMSNNIPPITMSYKEMINNLAIIIKEFKEIKKNK